MLLRILFRLAHSRHWKCFFMELDFKKGFFVKRFLYIQCPIFASRAEWHWHVYHIIHSDTAIIERSSSSLRSNEDTVHVVERFMEIHKRKEKWELYHYIMGAPIISGKAIFFSSFRSGKANIVRH